MGLKPLEFHRVSEIYVFSKLMKHTFSTSLSNVGTFFIEKGEIDLYIEKDYSMDATIGYVNDHSSNEEVFVSEIERLSNINETCDIVMLGDGYNQMPSHTQYFLVRDAHISLFDVSSSQNLTNRTTRMQFVIKIIPILDLPAYIRMYEINNIISNNIKVSQKKIEEYYKRIFK